MEAIDLICFKCKHLDELNGGCKAFKNIPHSITAGLNDHSKPLTGQKNNIVFEAKK